LNVGETPTLAMFAVLGVPAALKHNPSRLPPNKKKLLFDRRISDLPLSKGKLQKERYEIFDFFCGDNLWSAFIFVFL